MLFATPLTLFGMGFFMYAKRMGGGKNYPPPPPPHLNFCTERATVMLFCMEVATTMYFQKKYRYFTLSA